MERFVTGFIRASMVWFGFGILLGLAMAFLPGEALAYRPAHAHATMLGFVSMMIYGVAYHVLPRFIGRPLHSRRLAHAHLWIANIGLALLVLGWIGRVSHAAIGTGVLHTGSVVTAIGAFFFIYNVWRTLGPVRRAAEPQPELHRIRMGGAVHR